MKYRYLAARLKKSTTKTKYKGDRLKDIMMMSISFLNYLISAERPMSEIRNPTKFVIEPKLLEKLVWEEM